MSYVTTPNRPSGLANDSVVLDPPLTEQEVEQWQQDAYRAILLSPPQSGIRWGELIAGGAITVAAMLVGNYLINNRKKRR